jgi:hypothetical protein
MPPFTRDPQYRSSGLGRQRPWPANTVRYCTNVEKTESGGNFFTMALSHVRLVTTVLKLKACVVYLFPFLPLSEWQEQS